MNKILVYFSKFLSCTVGIYFIISLLSIYILVYPAKISFQTHNILFFIAFILHTITLVLRTVLLGHAPMASLFDSLLFYTWSSSLVICIMYIRYKEDGLTLFVTPVIFLSLLKAYYSPQPIRPLSPALQTLWFEVHVGTSFIAYGLFTAGFSAGILYLLKSKNKFNLCKYISSLHYIEKLVYISCAWGFFMFTIAMTSGGIWAYLAWSNYFIWTPKELFSVILWLYYSTYLHARYTPAWKGKKSAYLACGGFFLMIFTYLGISLLMRSSHSF